MMLNYTGNQTGGVPGHLPPPYDWWEAGSMFGSLIGYWYATGDTGYNDVLIEAMLHQAGPNNDYMPSNQIETEGNGDQGFWGLAAMSAAKTKFQNPPAGQLQWLALAQAVFNTQAARWDTAACGGGLRTEIFAINNSYVSKGSIANGIFFNIGARLAKYTNNDTYSQWADKTWDWMTAIGLLDDQLNVYEVANNVTNCGIIEPFRWSYNSGVMLLGVATMYNYTGDLKWKLRVDGLLGSASAFSVNDIMVETDCARHWRCDMGTHFFIASLSRWMIATTKLAPWTNNVIMNKLSRSATAAARQCSCGKDGRTCGSNWLNDPTWDGTSGIRQQMAALEVIQSNLISQVEPSSNSSTGPTITGDPDAREMSAPESAGNDALSVKDKLFAVFTTLFVIVALLSGT